MNKYIALYKGKQYEIESDTTYHAQQAIAKKLNVKNPYEIYMYLAEKENKTVIKYCDM